jgi:hypothetical protein
MIESYQVANSVLELTDDVIGLDLTASAVRTAGPVNNSLYHVANSVFCFIKFGDNTVDATAACTLLAPGERTMVLPNAYVSVIKASGSADGVIRLTAVK